MSLCQDKLKICALEQDPPSRAVLTCSVCTAAMERQCCSSRKPRHFIFPMKSKASFAMHQQGSASGLLLEDCLTLIAAVSCTSSLRWLLLLSLRLAKPCTNEVRFIL